MIISENQGDWPPNSFLAQLDEPTRLDFLTAGRFVQFGKNDTLMAEGDRDTDAFLLLSACVKVTARLDDGGYALLAVRVGGDVVGEMAALDGGPRSATVRACARQPVYAVIIGRDELAMLQIRHPDAALTMSRAVVHKLRSSTRRRIDYTGCTPKVSLARALVELADDYGRRSSRTGHVIININFTQVELGTLVGVHSATAYRALADLRDDGLISTESRPLYIRDIEALRTVAGWAVN
jgi:CRP-like cAMP-binding protein